MDKCEGFRVNGWVCRLRLGVTAALVVVGAGAAGAAEKSRATAGSVELTAGDLQPGARVDLTGQWLYKPGYELSAEQKPDLTVSNAIESTAPAAQKTEFAEAKAEAAQGYVPVPVPQILNRIQWWLDDSEDFKKHEAERLSKLGFDTDKAEDGWYRLEMNLPQLNARQHLYLQFDGIAMRSQVFFNGHSLGAHNGMFSRFEYEITPHVKAGRNTLAVFVSMEKISANDLDMGQAVTVNLTASKVKSLSKAMFGPLSPGRPNREYDLHGIWQPVRLVSRDREAIEDVYFQPTLNGADLNVTLSHRSTRQSEWRDVSALLIDERTSRTFAEFTGVVTQKDATTLSLTAVKPRLWTPADPNLYRLIVTLRSQKGETLDVYTHNVGFRTFEVKGNQLYLNGHPYWMRGADHLPYGKNPTDPALARKLIQQMHDNNERVTRTHCTPWNEAWLDAADEIGLGVSIEGPRPWAFAGKIGATPPDLFAHWMAENEDIIKRCRNHPSVLMWTIGNEMLIRDPENVEKWSQLSQLVKQTRALDPSRPIVCSSSYERDAKTYNKVVKPNGFDDGDIDDVHSYKGWYAESSFASDPLPKPDKDAAQWNRPYIGQEMSTGYPDLDTGLPALRYTADIMTPQAWVGTYAYPGNDPKWFLEHHAIVTKRWAEQLRYTRSNRTAGFFLFANECWFNHSYDPADATPYPVVAAVKEAWAPIGIALETSRRRFFAGETVKTNVFITNDDEQFRDLPAGGLRVALGTDKPPLNPDPAVQVPSVKYYGTVKVPITISAPAVSTRTAAKQFKLSIAYSAPASNWEGKFQSLFIEPVELFPRVAAEQLTTSTQILTFGKGASLDGLTTGGELRQKIEAGATCVIFSPGTEIMKYFPDEVLTSTKVIGEFADFSPAADTPLGKDLQPMDIKWWAREGDPRCFVASQAHKLKPGGRARDIVHFVPSHGYIRPEKVPDQVMTVMFEIPLGKGRVWVCDLDLDKCASVDPAAQLFLRNLWSAAADAHSMDKLKVLPSHEEMLKSVKGHKPTVGVYER